MALDGQLVGKVSRSALMGFGVGLTLSVLTTVATVSPPFDTLTFLQNPLTIVFTMLGMALGFE